MFIKFCNFLQFSIQKLLNLIKEKGIKLRRYTKEFDWRILKKKKRNKRNKRKYRVLLEKFPFTKVAGIK